MSSTGRSLIELKASAYSEDGVTQVPDIFLSFIVSYISDEIQKLQRVKPDNSQDIGLANQILNVGIEV